MITSHHPSRRSANNAQTIAVPAAFTLLEVILALALSVFVVASIAAAVRLQLVVLERQRQNIERSQIARNVLMMVKNDLRAAIQYKPADVTGLDELTVSQAAIAGGAAGVDPSTLNTSQIDTSQLDPSQLDPALLQSGQGAGQPSSGSSGAAAPSQTTSGSFSSANQNIAAAAGEPVRPGLYGNSAEILIDISRLPRIDQYSPVMAAGKQEAVSLPTDVKTVSYFVSDQTLETNLPAIGIDQSPRGGLYRRQLDRAVGSFAFDIAGSMASVAETKLIATEIVEIRFQYFDGEDWQADWDSDQQNGFPLAIEKIVIVDSRRNTGSANEPLNNLEFDQDYMQIYRSVVNLPIAEILPEPPAIQPAGAAGSTTAPESAGGGR